MLTFDEIEDCFPDGAKAMEDGITGVDAQWLHDFAHAIEAKVRDAYKRPEQMNVAELQAEIGVMNLALIAKVSGGTYTRKL